MATHSCAYLIFVTGVCECHFIVVKLFYGG